MAKAIRLEHVGIPARGERFDQTVAFYQRVFGWNVVREVTGGQRLTFLSDGQGGMLEILDVDGPGIPNPAHLAFMVPIAEFDSTREQLSDKGVAFDTTTVTVSGDHLAYFNDPAGNRAQLVGRVQMMG
ncbi:MAG TPA: VOC family protein [Thermomicrobiales bacterium]|nr:VOC family protein [Thermomicrobiales bacterium]